MARSSNIGAATTLQLPMQHKSANIARQNGKVHTTAPGFSRFNKILRVYIRCPAVITPNAHMHVIHERAQKPSRIQCSFKLMRGMLHPEPRDYVVEQKFGQVDRKVMKRAALERNGSRSSGYCTKTTAGCFFWQSTTAGNRGTSNGKPPHVRPSSIFTRDYVRTCMSSTLDECKPIIADAFRSG